MTSMVAQQPLHGFLLLPLDAVPGYRGVDRNPFEPLLLEGEMDPSIQVPENPPISAFYPPGWRQDAYRLYERNMVQGQGRLADLRILSSLEAATEIWRIITPHVGLHEIVACQVWELDSRPATESAIEAPTLGYDVAYPGGDFYSAILEAVSQPWHRPCHESGYESP